MSDTRQHRTSNEAIRLAELAEKLRDNSIPDAEVAELEAMLAGSVAARETFAGLAMLNADLTHIQGRMMMPSASATARRNILSFPSWPGLPRAWWRPLALAASIMILACLAWLVAPAFAPEQVAVANIERTSSAGLYFKNKVYGVADGAPLIAGSYELRTGIIEFTCTNGVSVLIESPARFNLLSAALVKLEIGKLSATVPEEGIGFTVEAPHTTVIDLGTEFAVDASPGKSDVHVMKGKVLEETAAPSGPQTLMANHAVRVDNAMGTPAGIDYDPQQFLMTLKEVENRYAQELTRLKPQASYRMRIMPDNTVLRDDIKKLRNHDGQIILGNSVNPWKPGRVGAAMRFGGADQGTYGRVQNWEISTNGTLSVCAWVKAESRPRWASIAKNWAVNRDRNLGGQFHFGLRADDGALEAHVNNTTNAEVSVQDSISLPLNQWQFVAFTMDGETLRLFRNGELVASASCAGLTTNAPAWLGIGAKLDEDGNLDARNPGIWDGLIDELTVFNYALAPEQIQRLYKILGGNTGQEAGTLSLR